MVIQNMAESTVAATDPFARTHRLAGEPKTVLDYSPSVSTINEKNI